MKVEFFFFSRGLATGQISGPDYCLRPEDGPYMRQKPYHWPEESVNREERTVEYRLISCSVFSVLIFFTAFYTVFLNKIKQSN